LWHRQRVFERIELQAHANRLIREQRIVGIREDGLDLDGVGCSIDGVVYGADPPGGQLLGAAHVPGLHRQRLAIAPNPGFARPPMGVLSSLGLPCERLGYEPRLQQRYLRSRHGKHQGDGVRLCNRHDAIGVRGLNHIAQVHLLQADASADGRHHLAIRQLQLCAGQRALVDLDRAFELAHQRRLGVELLFGYCVLGQQVLVAGQIHPGVFQLCAVPSQRAFGLGRRSGKGARINLCQQLARLDLLAFLELDALQHTTDLGMDDRRVGSRQAANGVDDDTDVLLARRAHRNRLHPVASTKAT